jgi:hypothetical protein
MIDEQREGRTVVAGMHPFYTAALMGSGRWALQTLAVTQQQWPLMHPDVEREALGGGYASFHLQTQATRSARCKVKETNVA